MAININVPQANQTLAATQNPILQNFIDINRGFNVNHGEYNGANEGKHTFLQFVQQAAAPATTATELALYTKAVTGLPQLFLRRESNGSEINFTSATASSTGEATLPSGIRIKWGTSTVAQNTRSAAINFPGTNFANVFMMQASQAFTGATANGDINNAVAVGELTVANFKLFPRAIGLPNGNNIEVFWFAIGN